jgi:hypothetical protein
MAGAVFTVTVMGNEAPVQVPAVEVGITLYITEPPEEVGLVNTWLIKDPDPALAPVIPPVIVPTLQVKLLGIFEVRLILVVPPEQMLAVFPEVTEGLGFTVMVKENGGPLQPLAEAMMLIVDVTGAVPVLVAVNEPIFPVPEVPKPILTELVQEKLAPPTALPKLAEAATPLQ